MKRSLYEIGAVFTMCLHTFTLFWLRKTSEIVEMFQLSLRVRLLYGDLSIFSVSDSSFFSYFLCYPYFGAFLSTWSLLLQIVSLICPNISQSQTIHQKCSSMFYFTNKLFSHCFLTVINIPLVLGLPQSIPNKIL